MSKRAIILLISTLNTVQQLESFILNTTPIIQCSHHHGVLRPAIILNQRMCHNRHNNIVLYDSYDNNNDNNNRNRYDKELEDRAELKAIQKGARSGAGETAAGAILGGLLLGPFGALFGASIGSSLGSRIAIDKAKKQELLEMGITEDMLITAREVGMALEKANEGLKATQDSLTTQQKFARRLESDADEIYEQAKIAMNSNNEDKARDLLMKRQTILDKYKITLKGCAEEKNRLEKMQDNVRAIEERATEVEALLKRNIGAKALMDSSSSMQFSLSQEDPLLKKFRDLGID